MRYAHARHAPVVRLTPVLMAFLIALLLCTTSTRASGQVTGSWNCGRSGQCATVMGAATGTRQFQTVDECHAWGQLNIPGGYSCSGSGGSGTSVMSMHVPAIVALFQSAIFGGGLGAAGGSMAKHENGEMMLVEGGLAGAALWGFISMSVNKSNWSRGSEIVMGTATGCAVGASLGVYLDNKAKTAPTGVVEDPRKVQEATGKGCAVGFVSGAVLKSLLNNLPPVRRLQRTSHPVSMINRNRVVGVRVAW